MKLKKPALVLILSIWTWFFSTALVGGGDATAKLDPIRIGYSSISGGRIMLWAAHERGFFARQGLQSELIIISGVQGLQALVSGDVQFFLGPTDSAAVLASRGGSGLVLLAFQEPTPYKLLVQPTIRTAKDLKGKKVVIDRIGGSSYHISLRLLEKIGLKAEDLEFIQVGGGGTQRAAAFKSGMVSAVVTSPERFEELKIPYYSLADAAESGIILSA